METNEVIQDTEKEVNYETKTKKELIDRINYLEIENRHLTHAFNVVSERLASYDKDHCPIYPAPDYWKTRANDVLVSFIRNGDKEKAMKEACIHTEEEYQEIMKIICRKTFF